MRQASTGIENGLKQWLDNIAREFFFRRVNGLPGVKSKQTSKMADAGMIDRADTDK
jgi:hypothetical protein